MSRAIEADEPSGTYRLQAPETHACLWGCPDCRSVALGVEVTRRDAATGAPTHAHVECACGFARGFVVAEHALARWRDRAGDPHDALDALVEGVFVGRVGVDQSARYYPPTAAVLPVERDVDYYDDLDAPALVATTVVFATGEHAVDGDDHLVRCSACDLRYDAGRTPSCPWCLRGIERDRTRATAFATAGDGRGQDGGRL